MSWVKESYMQLLILLLLDSSIKNMTGVWSLKIISVYYYNLTLHN